MSPNNVFGIKEYNKKRDLKPLFDIGLIIMQIQNGQNY